MGAKATSGIAVREMLGEAPFGAAVASQKGVAASAGQITDSGLVKIGTIGVDVAVDTVQDTIEQVQEIGDVASEGMEFMSSGRSMTDC